MIQVIYEDGTKERFTKETIDRGKKIKHEKVLTANELHKIPDTSGGKLVMRDKNTDELQAEQDAKQLIIDKANIEKKIQAGIRTDAIEKHLTAEEVAKIGE